MTPGSSPVPRRMARSMFSRGMLFALASAMIVRSRGFMPGSPPPLRAATVNSLMMRVKALPRLASAAPFLCLIVCHLEWPDMAKTPTKTGKRDRAFYHARQLKPGTRRWAPTSSSPVSLRGLLATTVNFLMTRANPFLAWHQELGGVPGAAPVPDCRQRSFREERLHVTTVPAPTMARSPIRRGWPGSSHQSQFYAPFFTSVLSTFQSAPVCSSPVSVVARG